MAEQNNNVNTENDNNNDENKQISNTPEIDNNNIEYIDENDNSAYENDIVDGSDIVNDDNARDDDNDEWYEDVDDDVDSGQYSRPVGYDAEDIADDENENTLDQEAITTFIQQLFTLQKKNIQKKRESRLIPSLNKFLRYDIDEKGANITPQMVTNLLHVCELIYTNKIDVKTHPSDLEVMEYILDKDTLQKDIKFTLVEDFHIHAYIRKAVKILEGLRKKEINGGNSKKVNVNRRRKIQLVN